MLASTFFAYRYGCSSHLAAWSIKLERTILIVAIAWLYVVFMMSITAQSATAGVVTFLLYGVFPLTIVLYLMGTPQRKRNRQRQEQKKKRIAMPAAIANAEDGSAERVRQEH